VCGPGKRIKCPKPPGTGRFKGGNSGSPGLFQRLRDKAEIKRSERESAKNPSSGKGEMMVRDFPGDVSPGGFPGDRGGDKNTKWTDTDSKFTRVDKKKSGGKIAKFVKKAVKKVVKKASIKKSSKKK
jgi:hypothetical protein